MYAQLMLLLKVLMGDRSEIQMNNDDFEVEYAVAAVNQYYMTRGDYNARHLLEIIGATVQEAPGILYRLTLRLVSRFHSEVCLVVVWYMPWLPGDQSMQTSKEPRCQDSAEELDDLTTYGGKTSISLNDSEVQNALDFAVERLNDGDNFLYLRKPITVNSVTSQVVDGILFHFKDVYLAATDCRKDWAGRLNGCNVTDYADARVCNFSVWSQAWMDYWYQLLNTKCQ